MSHRDRGPIDNTLTSDANSPGSTTKRGILELDTGYHPFGSVNCVCGSALAGMKRVTMQVTMCDPIKHRP